MVKFDKEKAWELENMLKLVLEGMTMTSFARRSASTCARSGTSSAITARRAERASWK